ncbi:unnamed protein product [Polarella glacialis]|nr:unnamed protein product [Polarella glacialis]
MEEGSSFWNVRVMLRALLCASVSSLVLNFFLVGFDSLYGFGSLGALGALTFGSFFGSGTASYHIWELPIFLVLGVFGGLLGASFNALNVPLTRWRMRCVGPRGFPRFLEVLAVTACISTAVFLVPLCFGMCYVTDVSDSGKAGTPFISCDPDRGGSPSFADTLGLFVTPSEDSIKVLFHDPTKLHNGLLAVFGALYFIVACWTYGLGVPSGLFVPSLLIGSVMGRVVGQLVQPMARGGGIASPGTYALIGAAASLAGMARITISVVVILVESTGNIQCALPLLFTVTVSKWVGDLFNEGIYDIHIGLKSVPLLPAFPEQHMDISRAADVMVRNLVVFNRVEKLQSLLDALEGCPHNGFPVVQPGTQQLCGMVSRDVLLHCLVQGQAVPGLFQAGLAVERNDPTTPGGLLPYLRPRPKVSEEPNWPSMEEVKAALGSPEAMGSQYLDLGPYVNSAAFVVREEATLRRAYCLFRTMGLRHLPVVGKDNCLRGLITRHELILATHDTRSA